MNLHINRPHKYWFQSSRSWAGLPLCSVGTKTFHRDLFYSAQMPSKYRSMDLMETPCDLKSLISNSKQTSGHLWPQGGIKSLSRHVPSGLRSRIIVHTETEVRVGDDSQQLYLVENHSYILKRHLKLGAYSVVLF